MKAFMATTLILGMLGVAIYSLIPVEGIGFERFNSFKAPSVMEEIVGELGIPLTENVSPCKELVATAKAGQRMCKHSRLSPELARERVDKILKDRPYYSPGTWQKSDVGLILVATSRDGVFTVVLSEEFVMVETLEQ